MDGAVAIDITMSKQQKEVGGPSMGLIKKAPVAATMARRSVIMCNDPNCNRCPPEMHKHMRQRMIRQAAAQLLSKDALDEDDEEEIEELQPVELCHCFGMKFMMMQGGWWQWVISIFHFGVMNPNSLFARQWIRFSVFNCLLAFSLDPLFFFVLDASPDYNCIYFNRSFAIALTIIRSISDVLFFIDLVLQFRLAFVVTSQHARRQSLKKYLDRQQVKVGDLITDSRAIATNYMRRMLVWDVLTVLPLPQAILWSIPLSKVGEISTDGQLLLRVSVLFQFLPRFIHINPLLTGSSGFVFDNAWASFLLNLFTFLMGSHVVGCLWYLLALQRVSKCFHAVCSVEADVGCVSSWLSCPKGQKLFPPSNMKYDNWLQSTNITSNCLNNASSNFYGIYLNAVPLTTQGKWSSQWIYCLTWGFQQIATLAGNLVATTAVGEVVFMLLVTMLGLFLFAFLIGNMQNFLQAVGRRSMEYQLHRRDVEQWMMQRDIPSEIQSRVRQLERYVWTVNQGVNEEEILSTLTEDLKRDIRRHLSLELITKCLLFSVMDTEVLDAICERLRQRLFIHDTMVIKEGMPVSRMFFILRGQMLSSTTDKGRTGFHETVELKNGDFFGEELLVYFIEKDSEEMGRKGKKKKLPALKRDVKISSVLPDLLPKSERTVICVGPVEGFSLDAVDLDFVCTQFSKTMQSVRVQRALNATSLNRRTRAATRIQVWFRARLRRRLGLTQGQMLQAVRTRRIGALLRSQAEMNRNQGPGGKSPLKQKFRSGTKEEIETQGGEADGAEMSKGEGVRKKRLLSGNIFQRRPTLGRQSHPVSDKDEAASPPPPSQTDNAQSGGPVDGHGDGATDASDPISVTRNSSAASSVGRSFAFTWDI
eukprot:TRINITY_DN9164_c0_g1_i1.p1 TRINITY_DN9164_c0_g1~~TRINITY_DN9164_c0_g1_i1.p1  ORF type:complete len:914 (-),score=241.95 TRINITY_DN9164_c0_g1_i1:493-3114(-)